MPDSVLNPRVAVYTGTFDPVHYGHLDIIERGNRLFERFFVGVGVNPDKQTMFTIDERVDHIRAVVADKKWGNVEVEKFDGLAVKFVRKKQARIMIRGLRTLSDMEYEFTMSLMNLHLDPEIETVFLMAKEEFSHVSSTLLRQIAAFGGDLSKFLPKAVADALIERARKPG
jgi:pantetheine-phosphate adenylyltransferase